MAKNDQKKAAALAALMECDTFTEAAEKAEISRKTLYNYLTEDQEFAKAHRAMQERRVIERSDISEANYKAAVQTVVDIMQSQETPAAVRLKAAFSLMEQAEKSLAGGERVAERNKDRTNPASPFHDIF